MIDHYPPGESGRSQSVELTLRCVNPECETDTFYADGYRELGGVFCDDASCPECGEDGEDL